jgi:hypothetical protein
MTLSSPQLQRLVSRVLANATGQTSPDAAQLSSAFDELTAQLRSRLQPLFGTVAMSALFARALHVAMSEFPWLGNVLEPEGDGRCTPDSMAILSAIDATVVRNGLAAVLAHQIGLLSAFVGEDLVLPLVQQAWGPVMSAEEAANRG